MIKVTIYRNKKHEYYGFDVEGHANFLEEGQDIVCAATSILVINTINSIEQLTKDETSYVQDEEAGSIKYRFSKVASHDAHILMHAMILGLESIEDDNINHDGKFNSYIDIIFKEVWQNDEIKPSVFCS